MTWVEPPKKWSRKDQDAGSQSQQKAFKKATDLFGRKLDQRVDRMAQAVCITYSIHIYIYIYTVYINTIAFETNS